MENDLDDILESAFEDLEQDERHAATAPPPTVPAAAASPSSSPSSSAAPRSPASAPASGDTSAQMEELRKLMEGLSRGDFQEAIDEITKSLEQSGDEAPDFANLIPDLEKLGVDADGNIDEAAMARLVEQLGDNPDMKSLMDGMFGHFVSKDILYEPMQHLRSKYPEWLEANRSKLSATEAANYERQQQIVIQICQVYETQPDNTEAVMALMTQMQETGQPPTEIMKSLAPDLQFGEDGQPVLPALGDKNCAIC
eukprot:TRINITY_DN12450_c0_g1_i1.p2 TRINITY_DN12450_c0_g1~~TRINITY_DN12450_c0_g1_i1.p2  ORF type:complete len:254 (-),score=115.16 TRINITY_DN12450_c0_g1_i1:36-797(-)